MWILSRLGITTRRRGRPRPATASSERTATPALPGAESSPPPLPPATASVSKPSFERSETNSSALITLQVSPDPPLVYTVEPVSGGWPWHRLTVHYVPSPDDLGLPTLPSDVFDSNSPAESSSPNILDDPDERPIL